MSLKGKAKETLEIIEQGGFKNHTGEWIDIKQEIEFSFINTSLYRPQQYESLIEPVEQGQVDTSIEVTGETTQIAAQRMVREGCDDLVLLNFASARNPGGGFINGAKAQEEDLSRCSTLYKCLLAQPEYYDVNREQSSMLYTDHIIYSPKVPWFRVRSRDDPNTVFLASVITAPAPNANQALRRGEKQENIQKSLHRRCGMVLGVARENGHRNIVLGAWGCGVFGNDPVMVAKTFREWLQSSSFKSAFDRVCFAVYDRTKEKSVYLAFEKEFQ